MDTTDEAEFRDFMAARWPALVRTAYLLTCDRQHAEDLAQTTLEKAASSWRRVRGSDDIDAYVRRMLVTTHLARFRRRRVAEVFSDAAPERAVGDKVTAYDAAGNVVKSASITAVPPEGLGMMVDHRSVFPGVP